ncbi:MAG: phosphoribosylformylglycinamidine cyclo-ligase [Synergistaceae bacterium]|nr:phosphoribosylformylglycinamidine cyclo-ligase [Synergistaceae bacterium]
MKNTATTMSYESAGVNIAAGDNWVEMIKKISQKYSRPANGANSGIGGFSGLYDIGGGQYLAACSDGVGTKVEIAKEYARSGFYRGLGQDLVAMCVNDLITCGAKPLFFLDYMACGKLNLPLLSEIMDGILAACSECSTTLLGGETAEMPGVYSETGFDLAGFSVGIVREENIINGAKIEKGNLLIGIQSSGLHSNGFSLARKALLSKAGLSFSLNSHIDGYNAPLAEVMLVPTKLYVKQITSVLEKYEARGMAHITGGGLEANCMRVVPEGLSIRVDYSSWKREYIFDLVASAGVEENEMRRVFNLGIGYVIIAADDEAPKIINHLEGLGECPIIIGEVI